MCYFVIAALSLLGLFANYVLETKAWWKAEEVATHKKHGITNVSLEGGQEYRVKIISYWNGNVKGAHSSTGAKNKFIGESKSYDFFFGRHSKMLGDRNGSKYKDISFYEKFVVAGGIYRWESETNNSEKYGSIRVKIVKSPNLKIHRVAHWVLLLSFLLTFFKWYTLKEEVVSEADEEMRK